MSNKVTKEQIDNLLNQSEVQTSVFFEKVLIQCYKLPSGFVICGSGSCVDPANFDAAVGKKYAREQVESKLWELEGYVLQNNLNNLNNLDYLLDGSKD